MQRNHSSSLEKVNKIFTDHLGYKVRLATRPNRIISLVPSITETLYHLGLEERIVGRTKFCVHPEGQVADTAKIGGTKTVDFKTIEELEPDLIIANKEENRKEDVEHLQELYTVWISDIQSIYQGVKLIKELGILLGVLPNSIKLTKQIAIEERLLLPIHKETKKAAYLIWKAPYMTVGSDTYIHSALKMCGFENAFGDQTRYPIVEIKDLIEKQPDYIFLSSEPFPFKEKHIQELKDQGIKSKIILVDGEMFSWYGSRILKALPYFRGLQRDYLNQTHLNVR